MELWKRNLYFTWSAQMLVMIGFTSALPFIPLYLQTLGVPTKEEAALWTGAMVALSFVVMAIVSPIWGSLADRYGRKSMVVRSMLAGSLIIMLLSFTTEVWQVFLLRMCQGAFAGSVTAAVALIASCTPKERMGFSLGLMQTAVFAGQSLGPLTGGFLGEHVGYRSAFLITSSFMFLATGLVFFFVKEDFTPRPAALRPEGSRVRAFGANWMQFMSQRQFMTMAVVLAMIQFTNIMLSPVLPIFIQGLPGGALKEAGMGPSSITGLILGVTGITSAISSVVTGKLSDKFGHRLVLIGCAAGAALLSLPQIFVGDTMQLLVLRGITGLFIGGIIPSANAIVSEVTPQERRGAAYGVIQSVGSLGMAAGPVVGALVAATLDARLVFLLMALMLFFISLWVSKVLQTRTAPPTTQGTAQPSGKSIS
jgi:MFS family permease